jgi:hypothetical protein
VSKRKVLKQGRPALHCAPGAVALLSAARLGTRPIRLNFFLPRFFLATPFKLWAYGSSAQGETVSRFFNNGTERLGGGASCWGQTCVRRPLA